VSELTPFDGLWPMPIEQCARTIVNEASLGDPRHQMARVAALQARVWMEIARVQEKTTRELVAETHKLVKATIAVALVTASAIVVAAITTLLR